ncbi:MAG: ATP-binding cassette domain-containing protein [Filifactoraceae bacterium]
MKTIIKTLNLCKNYDDSLVLNHINLEIKKGELIGLLGSNGAGKTTFLKLLSGSLEPTEGISIFSHCPWSEREKVLKRMGIMIETPSFYEHLTARENLKIHLEYLNIKTDINEMECV